MGCARGETSRRAWLRHASRTAVGLMAATGLTDIGPAGDFGDTTLRAMEPLGRNGSHFKFSLAAYSYRDLLQGNPPRLTLHDFINDCAANQLEGTELTSYYFPPNVTHDELRQLRRHCFRQGLDVSGTAVGNDFGLPSGEKRREQIEQVKRWVERAEILGAPVIRIFAGHVPEGEDAGVVFGRIVEAIEECCEHAGRHGVHLALENHGGPTATADGLLEFVKAVRSPWFGVNLDTGNFASDSVYDDLARVAPYALNVQVKLMVADARGQRQPVDYGRLAGLLRAANYRGYVVLEFEEAGDPRVECRRALDTLRAACS